ncbi:triple tyrosine motif-containing protein [Lentimicrobium saccharophilum]|nr:triple tyrosine motif-containing protein [Lentimicrobium saccharophilum]
MLSKMYTNRNYFSRYGRFWLLVILNGLFTVAGLGQIKDMGLPFINNYNKNTYKASNQNWSIAQNDKGFLYFGNNDGLLEFDGSYWELYPLPKRTILRSILAKEDTIFAGAFEEIGYFVPGGDGKMHFNSLVHLIPEYFRAFDEIWKIHNTSSGIVFQSFRFLFVYNNHQIKVIEPFSSFTQSFLVNGSAYVIDRKKGLYRLSARGLEPVFNDPLFQRTEVRSLLYRGADELLLGTSTEGLYILKNKSLEAWASPVNLKLKTYELFSGIALSESFYAFGTVQNGLYITDRNGRIYQHINRSKGLQNNTILCLFEDRHYNLWMGLDNGIDYAEINSPLSIFDFNYNLEASYTSIVHDGRLYTGTNQGLFYTELSNIRNSDEDGGKFTLISGTEGQVWSLQVFDEQLLCGHNTGCFLVNGIKALKISDIPGYWTFIRHRETSDTLIAGTYNGLAVFTKKAGTWSYAYEVKGFKESSRTILQDEDNTIWMSHGYRGIFHISLSHDLSRAESVTLYKASKGLPPDLPYNIHKIENELNISTSAGLYRYDSKGDVFYKNPKYTEIFGGFPYIDKITRDNSGNFWFFTHTRMGVIRETERGKYQAEQAPFFRINSMLLPSFEHLFIHNQANVYIGSQNGLIHFSPRFNEFRKRGSDPAYIRSIRFFSKDSALAVTDPPVDKEKNGSQVMQAPIPFRYNSASFRFSSPSFEFPEGTLFSYRLSGFDNDWSAWSSQGFKEYTNLKEGEYTFELKSINAFNAESEPVKFSFTIRPPFHRSFAAKLIYAILLLLILAGNIIFLRRRIEKARLSEILKREKDLEAQALVFREQALTKEKEIIHLRNEALQSEMNHKTKELANATLNLLHKNKILSHLKENLTSLLHPQPGYNLKHQISQLIRKINREIKNEQHLEAFNTYFDEVHQDFISRLKNAYPSLTPKELRLCAYLRMNLSSKEIAPLMNISVRGLEISRYRLRKKLNIEHNINLTDFIMSF